MLSGILIIAALTSFAKDVGLNDWESDLPGYVKSVKLQHESDKPMAVFFYTEWCSSCKSLREDVLSSAEVQAFMKDLHPVKINPETSAYEETLAQEFGVVGYPSFYIVKENGEVVTQIQRTTQISPAQFISQLRQAIDS
jgi:thiol:disulfide interchange protein